MVEIFPSMLTTEKNLFQHTGGKTQKKIIHLNLNMEAFVISRVLPPDVAFVRLFLNRPLTLIMDVIVKM